MVSFHYYWMKHVGAISGAVDDDAENTAVGNGAGLAATLSSNSAASCYISSTTHTYHWQLSVVVCASI